MTSKIKILCLHDKASSAEAMLDSFKQLEERLYSRHGVEFCFVDSPLIFRSDDSVEAPVRNKLWFYDGENGSDVVGLDASILHLKQIWNRSMYSDPYSGIMGIGQGAIVAALLPLLTQERSLKCDEALEDQCSINHPMFEGLKFCIFIHGQDILASSNADSNDDVVYCGCDIDMISRLHIICKDNDEGFKLYDRWGGSKRGNEKFVIDGSRSARIDVSMMNVIGRYVVSCKKEILSVRKEYYQHSVPNSAVLERHSPKSHTAMQPKLGVLEAADVTVIRRELAELESRALELINTSIATDPPKSLLAVISQSAVGGWMGERNAFRSKDFIDAGGAPCPPVFNLPRGNRLTKVISKEQS